MYSVTFLSCISVKQLRKNVSIVSVVFDTRANKAWASLSMTAGQSFVIYDRAICLFEKELLLFISQSRRDRIFLRLLRLPNLPCLLPPLPLPSSPLRFTVWNCRLPTS